MKRLYRVPFVLGVTGNMDPAGYQATAFDPASEEEPVRALRRKIRAVMEWLFGAGGDDGNPKGFLDPRAGEFRRDAHPPADTRDPKTGEVISYLCCWRPLGLRNTPVVVLSSLAPGIDTIVAEEALACARENPEWEISVRAPLPFPLDVYRRASTFGAAEDVARLDRLVSALRAQPDWVEERDLFCVALDADLEGAPEDDLSGVTPTVPLGKAGLAPGKPRRRLRYRAAGEFIASQCDLLLACYDVPFDGEGTPEDVFESGAATIVAAKQQGLAWELLAAGNNFAWADNGPVLRIPVRRSKRQSTGEANVDLSAPEGLQLDFLHPHDSRPEDCPGCPGDDPRWQKRGDEVFRRIARQIDDFNAAGEGESEGEGQALYGLVLGSSATRDANGDTAVARAREALGSGGFALLRQLAPVAALRSRAGAVSRRLQVTRSKLLKWLIVLIGVAAFFLGVYEHWNPQGSEGHAVRESGPDAAPLVATEAESLVQSGFLVIVLAALLASAAFYHRHLRSRAESRRYDARAVAEGLRVQFYWCLVGLGHSVPANYMQRQRGELDWIRWLISSACFPYQRWREGFRKLPAEDRLKLLNVVRERWVTDQLAWFERTAREYHQRKHFWEITAWSCAAAGLLQVVLMLAGEVSPAFDASLCAWRYPVAGGMTAAAGLLYILGRALTGHPQRALGGEDPAPVAPFVLWLLRRWEVWSPALLFSAPVFLLPHWLPQFGNQVPDRHDWWIILTGGLLLTGGLSLAWIERNFLPEISRQYRSMRDLFACADRRLEPLLKRLAGLAADSPEYLRTLDEAQDLLYQLGCEALDENAEWLLLHRARPLEPFMAG